ncbi:unnamed protein product [Paramecium sonneborni]|uniref:Uncharacterized protein n=1 Tax=Paramecium sonneborni TaxID=65129 RepID=A0A8S1RF38_9CILI|nr:unnamed protein product [Paramecium sonneborni]
MKIKDHHKVKSIHTVQEVSNTKTFFIGRTTQRSFMKNTLPLLPIAQICQIQVPAPLSGRVVSRKLMKGISIKTLGSVGEDETQHQQSLFQLIVSPQFKNIISEEKQKKDEGNHFTLDGPVQFKIECKQKIFKQGMKIGNYLISKEDNVNIKIFLKKIRQIMTTSHIQHNDIHTNENSFLSDKFKTQMTSPRFTFTNHLSTIQYQNQPTSIQKAGSTIMLDPIEEKKEQLQPTTQINRRILTISVFNPENQVGVYSFSVPDYCVISEQHNEELQVFNDQPKHVLKSALQFITQQTKKNTSKFSKSIQKIIGITDQENLNEDVHQFYNLEKTSRFTKMYLQNKMSRIFTKLEENILMHFQLIQEKRSSISILKLCESQQSSRLQSCYTSPINIYSEQLSNPIFEVQVENQNFIFNEIYWFDYSFDDHSKYNIDSFNSDFTGYDIIECQSTLKITNFTSYLNFIISSLDGQAKNLMLQDENFTCDIKIIKDSENLNDDKQINRTVNSLYRYLKKKDHIKQVNVMMHRYNEILTGIFEDEHEIDNLINNYGFTEVDDQTNIQQPTNKINIKFTKPIKKKPSNHDQSPPSERSNQKHNSKIISPRNQTTINQNNTSKPLKQLLEATSSQTSVVHRRSDSPQEDTSIKETSNINTTQSNKMKVTQTMQNTTIPISQKEETVKPLVTKSQERRNAFILASMGKHALQMRTQITEAQRRQSIQTIEIIKLLIEEQKLCELEEVFSNNPNQAINERLKENNTYLILAAQTGNIEIVQFLLHRGAQINLQNNDGDTALHKAIAYHFYNVADILIAQGAQNLRNCQGLTPWQLNQ